MKIKQRTSYLLYQTSLQILVIFLFFPFGTIMTIEIILNPISEDIFFKLIIAIFSLAGSIFCTRIVSSVVLNDKKIKLNVLFNVGFSYDLENIIKYSIRPTFKGKDGMMYLRMRNRFSLFNIFVYFIPVGSYTSEEDYLIFKEKITEIIKKNKIKYSENKNENNPELNNIVDKNFYLPLLIKIQFVLSIIGVVVYSTIIILYIKNIMLVFILLTGGFLSLVNLFAGIAYKIEVNNDVITFRTLFKKYKFKINDITNIKTANYLGKNAVILTKQNQKFIKKFIFFPRVL